jgi:ketosteroid isomerase-like protein
MSQPSSHGVARPLLAAILLCLSMGGSALAAPQDPVVAELTKQADAWDKAIVRKDRAAVEANMADDFRSIDGAGTVETKSVFVNGLMDTRLTIDPYTVEDFDVRLLGDVALLSGRTRMTGKFDGKPFTSHYRYIDIYARRNGRWQIVSVQITRLAS